MAFQLSPGVLVQESDLTNVIPAVASSSAGFAGQFAWGPVGQIMLVSSENELLEEVGKPYLENQVDWFSAANFLGYGNNLQLVRATGAGSLNAASSGTGVRVDNEDDYVANHSSGTGSDSFIAKYPGTIGNSLLVSVADSASFANWAYAGLFDSAPGTSDFASKTGCTNDELHIIVIDQLGAFTGQVGSVLEKFAFVSKQLENRSADGASNYYKTVINDRSKYVWWGSHLTLGTQDVTTSVTGVGTVATLTTSTTVTGTGTAFTTAVVPGDLIKTDGGVVLGTVDSITSDTELELEENATAEHDGAYEIQHTEPQAIVSNWGSSAQNIAFASLPVASSLQLSGGVVAGATDANITAAYDLFANKELVDVALLITGGHSATVAKHVIENIAVARLDCIAFCSPSVTSVLNNPASALDDVLVDRNSNLNVSSSYAVMDSGWKVQYNRYADTYINMPLNPDVAGLCARTDQTNDAWWSPAGLNRGQIKNVVKLLWSPNQAERDELYKAGINPVISLPGQGTVLYGDKTLLSKPSAFDRINVRRLFIVLEKAIATAAKYQLFEFNDTFTRSQFRSMVEPFLRDVRGRRGIYDFRVVCDETNNTGEVIDRNEFVADIYIKPARSINFIQLNFIATRTSVSFEEVGA